MGVIESSIRSQMENTPNIMLYYEGRSNPYHSNLTKILMKP